MKLSFIEDKNRDIKNWQDSVKKQSHGTQWVKFLPKDINLECVDNIDCLSQYLETEYYSTNEIKECIDELSKSVNADQIQQDIELILQCKFKTDNYRIFITTFHRAPFNLREHYFFIILNKNTKRMITNIYHELMHFLFYQNWYDFCKEKGLNDNQIDSFKEILTVLLNRTLERRGLPLDIGYPIHQELRSKTLDLYKKNKNLREVLDEMINLVKAANFN